MRWLVAFLLLLLVPQAHAALMLATPPYRPKDFTIVKKDGTYHLFYIRHNMQLPESQTEVDLGHATSTDMYTWVQQDPVLAIRPDNWDNYHVWAPSIVERDGVYYMFYTGVTNGGAYNQQQRIGLATSTDLYHWNRMDAPIYGCDQVPWAWCDSTDQNTGFRDPFVMPDPTSPGHWLMEYVTFPDTDHSGMIVGVATSNGDLTQWADLRPLWITNRAYSFNSLVESPHEFYHDGQWFLFFTTGAGQPLSYCVGLDAVGGNLARWNYKGRLSNMLGYDTSTWFASEYFRDGIYEYFLYCNYNRIEIHKMVWNPNQTFALYEPGDYHVRNLLWSSDSTSVGGQDTLTIVASGWPYRTAELEALEMLPGGGTQLVPIDSIGIPAEVDLQAESTGVAFTPRIWRANGDTLTPQHIIVRMTDLTCVSNPLAVRQPPPPPPPVRALLWSSNAVQTGHRDTLKVFASDWSGQTAALEAFEALPGGGQTPIPIDSLGLPSSLALTADTTRVSWRARIWRANGDTLTPQSLIVQRIDGTAVAQAVTVSQPPPPPPPTRALAWSSYQTQPGHEDTLSVVASDWSGQTAALETFEALPGGGQTPIPIDSLGLPSSLALTADTTRVVWHAKIWRANGDTLTPQSVIVRRADTTAVAQAVMVTPPAAPPPPVHALFWSSYVMLSGDDDTLSVIVSDWQGNQADLVVFERTIGGAEVAIPNDSLGLPAVVTLTGDTTRIVWRARMWRASGDTLSPQKLIVRRQDGTASAAAVGVYPNHPPAIDGPPDPVDKRLRFRALRQGPAGNTPALLVDLARPGAVKLDLYDLQGRRVRNLVDRELPIGATVVLWDGRNGDGWAVPKGMYFARLVTPEGVRTARVLLLKSP